MDKHSTIATSVDKPSRKASVSKSAAGYKLLKDLPLTDYVMRNGWQQTATCSKHSDSAGVVDHRREPVVAWGSFDVETYCSLGGTVRIGVNGKVRQPSRDDIDCECVEDMRRDQYNHLLRKVNEKNGTLGVSRASEVYNGVVHTPLCWEDQLSDVQVILFSTVVVWRHAENSPTPQYTIDL